MKFSLPRLRGLHVATLCNLLVAGAVWAASGIPILPFRRWSLANLAAYAQMLSLALAALFLVDCGIKKCTGRLDVSCAVLFRRAIGNRRFLLSCLSVLIAFEMVITIHTTLKQAIPCINGARHDALLLRLDRWLAFGVDLPLALSASPNLWRINEILDGFYTSWFYVLPVMVGYFLYFKEEDVSDLFLTSLSYLFGLGILVGLALPSLGPFYIHPGSFPAVGMYDCLANETLLRTVFDNVRLEDIVSGKHLFFGYGLMAMPSLHIGVCFLYVFFLWREHRLLRALAVVYLWIVFIGSLMSGWHYALDGIAAVPLVWLAVGLARATLAVLGRPGRRGRPVSG